MRLSTQRDENSFRVRYDPSFDRVRCGRDAVNLRRRGEDQGLAWHRLSWRGLREAVFVQEAGRGLAPLERRVGRDTPEEREVGGGAEDLVVREGPTQTADGGRTVGG